MQVSWFPVEYFFHVPAGVITTFKESLVGKDYAIFVKFIVVEDVVLPLQIKQAHYRCSVPSTEMDCAIFGRMSQPECVQRKLRCDHHYDCSNGADEDERVS